MENKFQISKENYELLSKMIALAKTRQPVQGKFTFRHFNKKDSFSEKEGIKNCGTAGCLAGGYLPLIDGARFRFTYSGTFKDGRDFFDNGRLRKELGKELFDAFFMPNSQSSLGLKNLLSDSTLKLVNENAEKVLEMCEVKQD